MTTLVLVGLITTSILAQTKSPAGTAGRVPLRTGLTIVTAIHEPDGDYESIKQITTVNDQLMRLTYSSEEPATGTTRNLSPAASTVRKVNTTRTVAREDLENAIEYRWVYTDNAPPYYAGSTAVGVSRKVLNDLKTRGETPLSVPAMTAARAPSSLFGALQRATSGEGESASTWSGTLTRVSREPVPFKVLLNDEPVELSAVHARGRLGEQDAEFWILDDPDNPLALEWQVGNRRLQVIKLAYPSAAPAATNAEDQPKPGDKPSAAAGTAKRIQDELATHGRAIVYGIYFDFASDRIKAESEPVLAEIAQVLRANATWNLNLEGHTDNIGGDAYNLDLSKRRSAAVRQALVTRYKIGANRLQTSGYGASRPKDRNDTMQGRARNRRVELVKLP